MELRKCECGGKPKVNAYLDDENRVFAWDVFCSKCKKETYAHDVKDQAIQAWNEGKVE